MYLVRLDSRCSNPTIQTITSGPFESVFDVDKRVVIRDSKDVRSHRIAGDRLQLRPLDVGGHADGEQSDTVATGGSGRSHRGFLVGRRSVKEDNRDVAAASAISVQSIEH